MKEEADMRNIYFFATRIDEPTGHRMSKEYDRPEACRASAEQFVEDHQIPVKLYSSDGFIGHVYAVVDPVDGGTRYCRSRG